MQSEYGQGLRIDSPLDLGLILRAARQERRLTIAGLAQTLGLAQSTVTNVEEGKGGLGTLLLVMRELGVHMSVDVALGPVPQLAVIDAHAASSVEETD
ncbi:helix-turn-helix transcriptional regulator [Niveibacterium sp. SC-1]|uniref:helix-turn-helix transcriptional regulator n=1 Tax=Niveibacterium sp. SC-1 TaxID=3135646 RepID=UPI00311DF035